MCDLPNVDPVAVDGVIVVTIRWVGERTATVFSLDASELRRTRVGGDHRATANLNRRRVELLGPLREAEARVERLEEIAQSFEIAVRYLETLSTCTSCGSSSDFEPRAQDCF